MWQHGWLFAEIVDRKQQKSKAVDYREAVETVNRLHQECVWLLRTWAMFEVANGYPTKSHADTLRELVSLAGEEHGLNVLRETLIRDTVMTAYRMLEQDSSGRRNLSSLGSFLGRVRNSDLLSPKRCDLELCRPERATDWFFMNQLLSRLEVSLLSEDITKKQSIVFHRSVVRGYRDHAVAHSLAHLPYSGVTLYQLRDAIVFIGANVSTALMLIKGTNWRPQERWHYEVKDARQFWVRYQNGFIA